MKYNDSGSHKNVPRPAPRLPSTPADRVCVFLSRGVVADVVFATSRGRFPFRVRSLPAR